MENAALIGLSRQIALGRELDVIANNMANVSTNGYREGAVARIALARRRLHHEEPVALDRGERKPAVGLPERSGARARHQKLFEARLAQVQAGAIERSNVKPVIEMSRLIDVNRSYTTISTMLTRMDELRRTALSRLSDQNA